MVFLHLKIFSQWIAVQESHFVWCIMYSCWIEPGWRSVDSDATVVLFRIVKNNDGYPIKAEDWFCVWIFCKKFEDRLDFKCNLREVIEVHVNQFCFVKIFTRTQYVCPEKNLILLVLLEIIRPRQNNKNFVFREWLVWRFYHFSGILRLKDRVK